MTCSDEHSIGLREHLIELVGKEMQNPDNKDFYREDLVNDLNLENNETTATPEATKPKPKSEGKPKPKPKPNKPEPEAKKDAKAKAKATRAALLKKLAGLQGKDAPSKEAQEEEGDEDEDEASEEEDEDE